MSFYQFILGGVTICSALLYFIPRSKKMELALQILEVYENLKENYNQAMISNVYKISALPGKECIDLPFEFEDVSGLINFIKNNISILPDLCVINYSIDYKVTDISGKEKDKKRQEFTYLLNLDIPYEQLLDHLFTFTNQVSQTYKTEIENPIMTLEVNDIQNPEIAELFRRCLGPKGDFYGNRPFPLKNFYLYTQQLSSENKLKKKDILTIIYNDNPFEEFKYTTNDIINQEN